jgi:hypothetical protein
MPKEISKYALNQNYYDGGKCLNASSGARTISSMIMSSCLRMTLRLKEVGIASATGSTKISTILKIATHKYCTIEPPSSILLIEEAALATPSRARAFKPRKSDLITSPVDQEVGAKGAFIAGLVAVGQEADFGSSRRARIRRALTLEMPATHGG